MRRTVLLKQSKGRPPTKVICTGHSLGAALASLCGVWASLQWLDADVRVVTFGSPAVGNQEFANVRLSASFLILHHQCCQLCRSLNIGNEVLICSDDTCQVVCQQSILPTTSRSHAETAAPA